jgi:hypothetical protein
VCIESRRLRVVPVFALRAHEVGARISLHGSCDVQRRM